MNQVVQVKEEHRKNLPYNNSCRWFTRIQTLKQTQHKRMYQLLTELHKINDYPIVLNTSFNLKDQTMLDPNRNRNFSKL